jgi:hypothetical protein
MKQSATLRAGDWVQVRSKEEILGTLDKDGRLEGLPFMPEMLAFCGQKFRVYKRAHKTCDPPNGLCGRGMQRAVHLEGVRCNGEGHGGCQARCLIFWKEAWLVPVGEHRGAARASGRLVRAGAAAGCTEQEVIRGARADSAQAAGDDAVYVCQSTHLSQSTYPLRWWDPRQYIEDYTSGNARISELLSALFVFLYAQLESAGIGLGAALRWLYDTVQKLRGGLPYPKRSGKVPLGRSTPRAELHVQPGELVRIRSYAEILETINEANVNRGMVFDQEMVPYCGKAYTVLARVTQIIDERTGKMRHFANDCIMLDGVICRAWYSKYRRFCPRSIYPYWREVWLERAGGTSTPGFLGRE